MFAFPEKKVVTLSAIKKIIFTISSNELDIIIKKRKITFYPTTLLIEL